MRKVKAFTLIEVLVVVAILALLISIMMPSLKEVRRLSKRTVCQKNLEQIGVSMQAYLISATPKDTFPYACRLPSWEREDAKKATPPRKPLPSLPEVLKTELPSNKSVYSKNKENFRSNEVFSCPADENTMSLADDTTTAEDENIPTRRYFDHEGTSYEWESNLNGSKLEFKVVRIYGTLPIKDPMTGKISDRTRKFEVGKVPKSNMWMLYDFEAFHGGPNVRGSHNVLYTDLHVEADKWTKDKQVGRNKPS